MWPTCLIRKKQPSSSKRLPLPSMGKFALADKMISADPIRSAETLVGYRRPRGAKTMDHINVKGQGGTFLAYIARSKTLPAPAVVVLQELFGVNADIRKHCDELAEQGYIAVAPDLYWRQEPGVNLNVTSEADWQHGLRLYQGYDRDAGAKDV